jgi:hypothetical protein
MQIKQRCCTGDRKGRPYAVLNAFKRLKLQFVFPLLQQNGTA